MLIIVNPTAGAGNAIQKWQAVKPHLPDIVGPFTSVVTPDVTAARHALRRGLDGDETQFVAAGGDGTVNLVATSIVLHASKDVLGHVKLGAIGLGSSNDFHKPLHSENTIEGVPCKLNFASTIRHDVCRFAYEDQTGNPHTRHWIVNASVGTTAEANWFFNNPDRVLKLLKRLTTGGAIAYATLRTLATYRGCTLTLSADGCDPIRTRVNNLGIVKNPHFTGALRYDSPHEPGSGYFHVHLLADVSTLRLLVTLYGLYRGRFAGSKGTRSWRTHWLELTGAQQFALEGDGEVIAARHASFSVLPRLLEVCT